jgi:hypothetical protein
MVYFEARLGTDGYDRGIALVGAGAPLTAPPAMALEPYLDTQGTIG